MTSLTPTATPAEVHTWLASGSAVLIDVREPDEYASEHIAGSLLNPLSRFDANHAVATARPGRHVVFQCRSGKRSADACRLAQAAVSGSGNTAFTSMAGGIEAWKAAGLPVESARATAGAQNRGLLSTVSVMRQVQFTIGVAVLTGSALAWFVHPAFLVIPAFFGAGLVFAGASGTCGLAAVLGACPWNRPA